jgi:hypothetical protein
MDIVDKLAEARIQEALERGQLSNLQGEGQPLKLDNDALIPEELRAGYRLLKNAGFLPPDLQLQREISEAEQLLARIPDGAGRNRARIRLDMLRLQLEAYRGQSPNLQLEEHYRQKIVGRFEQETHKPGDRDAA